MKQYIIFRVVFMFEVMFAYIIFREVVRITFFFIKSGKSKG